MTRITTNFRKSLIYHPAVNQESCSPGRPPEDAHGFPIDIYILPPDIGILPLDIDTLPPDFELRRKTICDNPCNLLTKKLSVSVCVCPWLIFFPANSCHSWAKIKSLTFQAFGIIIYAKRGKNETVSIY